MHAARTIWLLLLPVLAYGQPIPELKSHLMQPFRFQPRGQTSERHLIHTHRHLLVQFSALAGADDLGTLRDQGYRIVQYLTQKAYIVTSPDWLNLDGAIAHPSRIVFPEEKLSADLDLTSFEVSYALVEFYPDVNMNDARSIVLQSSLNIQDNLNLLSHHLLVYGDADAIAAIADWDEVAYVFPAADALIQGIPLNACAGALTDFGQIGQSIAIVGGWGGPGLTGADLKYGFFDTSPQIPADGTKEEIVRAFGEWAKYARLTFTNTDDLFGRRTLMILFGSREHGDSYPFDGPGGVLAHTFYPYPANPEPIAGDLHFDADESWKIGADPDLFSVALHETGHALGLGHSDRPGAVMYPYYRRTAALTAEDIAAILTLYAPQEGPTTPPAPVLPLSLTVDAPGSSTTLDTLTLNGTASGGSGGIRVTWSATGGSTGIAVGSSAWTIPNIPLELGLNLISLVATDTSHASVACSVNITQDREDLPVYPITLQITTPAVAGTYVSQSASMTVSGIAASVSGVSRIQWSTSQNRSGEASGTTNWIAGAIPLDPGNITITIAALGVNGTTASQSIQASYAAPAKPVSPVNPVPTSPTGTDTTSPTLVILSPSMTYVSTNASSLSFSGTANDEGGVAVVTWTTSNGDAGTAQGANNWSATIPLLVGSNLVSIRAQDKSGNIAWRSVTVARR